MTVNYNNIISSGHRGAFTRLLIKWRGSLYKLVWVDLLFYVGTYYVISCVYRFTLRPDQREKFEHIVLFCHAMKNNIPVSFLLGFFVSGVIGRWWKMFYAIPRLHRLAFVAQSFLTGTDAECCRRARYTFMRYMLLSWILLMRKVSEQIRNRFPTRKHGGDEDEEEEETDLGLVRRLMEAINRDPHIRITYRKLVTEEEIRLLEKYAAKRGKKPKSKSKSSHGDKEEEEEYLPGFWIPLQWGARWVQKGYLNGYIADPRTMVGIVEEVDELRRQMQTLKKYSQFQIPLVYTQVVIIAVCSFFLCQLFAGQYLDPKKRLPGHEVDFYVPVFPIFQFLYLMGWLKVALCVMNPFGDDDEDFETSKMLDDALDITFRSVDADPSMFPKKLHPPANKFKVGEFAKDDNFKQFQDAEQQEFASVPLMMHLDTFPPADAPKRTLWQKIEQFLSTLP